MPSAQVLGGKGIEGNVEKAFIRNQLMSVKSVGICLEPSRKPLNLLVKKLNGEVSIRLKNDVEYRGKMIECDSHMNIILEGATEYKGSSLTANFGNVILRGSNVLYICVDKPRE